MTDMADRASPPNLFEDLPDARAAERFATIVSRPGVRIERIVSQGQVTPIDRPYRQAADEWVVLLAGGARLWIDGVGERTLGPGDHVLIAAQVAHRVTFTDPAVPTIWLAIHFADVDETRS